MSLYMYVLVGSLWKEGGNMENWAIFLGTHGHIRGNTARAVPRERSGEIKIRSPASAVTDPFHFFEKGLPGASRQ